MALIKDKILHSKEELTEKDFEYLKLDRNLGDLILNGFKEVIEENGDYDWLINGPYETLGFTSSIGSKIRKASEVEPQARKIASAFYKHGLRKGDVVHLAIPNSTENHCIAIGAWLCEAIVSLGDPGLSVNVLKTQLKETNAKMIVCFEGSRKVILNAIKEMNLLGKVVVVVMPLACPEMGQDLPITEEGFQFFQGDFNFEYLYAILGSLIDFIFKISFLIRMHLILLNWPMEKLIQMQWLSFFGPPEPLEYLRVSSIS